MNDANDADEVKNFIGNNISLFGLSPDDYKNLTSTQKSAIAEAVHDNSSEYDSFSDLQTAVENAVKDEQQKVKAVEDATKIDPYAKPDKGSHGEVWADITLGVDVLIKDLSEYKVTIYNDDNELAVNTLSFERFSGNKDSSGPVSVAFAFGQEGNNEWSWNQGAYSVSDLDNLTQDDLPNKMVVEFTTEDGIVYEVEKELSFTPSDFS